MNGFSGHPVIWVGAFFACRIHRSMDAAVRSGLAIENFQNSTARGGGVARLDHGGRPDSVEVLSRQSVRLPGSGSADLRQSLPQRL